MRVLVLDTDSWREMGIARVLDRAPDITPILDRDLGDQTISRSLASVVLMSEGTMRADAHRSLRAIRRKLPQAKILVHGERMEPAAIAELLAQGADGYLALSSGEETLLKAIRVVARGAVWVPETAVTNVVERLRSNASSAREHTLDASTLAMLRMLEEGLSNKEMAARLDVAEITVKTRLSRLYRRFGVQTRTQLLSFAMRQGLLPRH